MILVEDRGRYRIAAKVEDGKLKASAFSFFGKELEYLSKITDVDEKPKRGKIKFDVIDFGIIRSKKVVKVLKKVMEIPKGKTKTYGEIAEELGYSPRFIGLALSKNPFLYFVPCHRVVAKRGIGGFSIGIHEKVAMLREEGINI